jgi:hypothetical protein
MIWDVFARGKWNLSLAILGAIAWPAMILGALHREGSLNPTDSSMLMMHTIMTLVAMVACGAAILPSQGKISKLYTYPLTNMQVVAWRLLPAMAIIVVQMAIVLAAINGIFHLDWPIWGPALAAATGLAAITASLLLTENSNGWLILTNGAVGAVVGLWFRSRYGGMFSEPLHYWQTVTAGDVLTMLAMIVASFWVAHKAVARNRCGEPPFSLGILDRVNRALESCTTFNTVASTAVRSQCRYEWQRKGWLMPASVALLIGGGLIGWYFGSRDPQDLILGFLGGGGALWMLGFIGGVVFGNTGRNDADFVMGTFLATRPMADADLARAILRTAAASVFAAWLIWAMSAAIVFAVCGLTGSLKADQFRSVNWFLYPASLLGPWAIAGALVSILLSGRIKLVVIVFSGLSAATIAAVIASTLLPSWLWGLLYQSSMVTAAVAILLATPVIFAVAYRRDLVGQSAILALGTFWIAAATAAIVFWPATMPFTFSVLLATAISLSLMVLPFAAAPLAIAANRHR